MSSHPPCFQILQLSIKILTRQMNIPLVSQCREFGYRNPVVDMQLHLFSVNKTNNGSYQETVSICMCNDFQVCTAHQSEVQLLKQIINCVYLPTIDHYSNVPTLHRYCMGVTRFLTNGQAANTSGKGKQNFTSLHLIHFPSSRLEICVCLFSVWLVG